VARESLAVPVVPVAVAPLVAPVARRPPSPSAKAMQEVRRIRLTILPVAEAVALMALAS
jgi:hypothetical protein